MKNLSLMEHSIKGPRHTARTLKEDLVIDKGNYSVTVPCHNLRLCQHFSPFKRLISLKASGLKLDKYIQ